MNEWKWIRKDSEGQDRGLF